MQKNAIHFTRQFAGIFFGLLIVFMSAGKGFAAPSLVKGMPDLSPLVEECAPAVVLIINKVKVQKVPKRENPGEFLNRIFGIKKEKQEQEPLEDVDTKEVSGGSGFLISPDGYILTNQHVVIGADELEVRMKDGRVFKATMLGADKTTDVALLKINSPKSLPFLKVGKSADIKAGQWVIAIGSPLFLEDSVSFGIVSNKARDKGDYLRSIQMDAAINQGNSGGPAINIAGEVIGINHAILSESKAFSGISLAIPIDDALKVANELKNHGRVIRGNIGVSTFEIDASLIKEKHLSQTYGVFVSAVTKGGPADKAGIKPNDIILQFDNHAVYHPLDVIRLVGNSKPGYVTQLLVFRGTRKFKVPVVLDEKKGNSLTEPYFTVK